MVSSGLRCIPTGRGLQKAAYRGELVAFTLQVGTFGAFEAAGAPRAPCPMRPAAASAQLSSYSSLRARTELCFCCPAPSWADTCSRSRSPRHPRELHLGLGLSSRRHGEGRFVVQQFRLSELRLLFQDLELRASIMRLLRATLFFVIVALCWLGRR